MRIGIDARELCGRATGVGRYLGGLLQAWSIDPQARRHEFVLYAPGPIALALDARRFATRLVRGSGGTWWEQAQAPRAAAADHLDVWFAPAYSAPLRLTIPVVVAIHDLSFVAHPEWFRFREGARRRWLTRKSAHKATSIVTISEFSRRELVERLDVSARRIHVIPPGIVDGRSLLVASRPGSQQPASNEQPPGNRQRATSPPRVLYVGSLFNRRHISDLIRAFAPIARTHADASLDLVGDNRSYPYEDPRQTIALERLDGQVRWHEYVSEDDLRALYMQARAFAFLSEYEGLGLTPLEALAAGVPPVLLDTAVARESCGDAGLYVPVRDVKATTQALESLLFDGATRARVLAAAPDQLAKYDWTKAGRETLEVLEHA